MWIIHKLLWITVQCFSVVVENISSTSLEWNKKKRNLAISTGASICRWASIGGHFHSFGLWPQFSSSVIPQGAVEPRGCQWITRQFPVSAFTTDCTGGFWLNTTSVTPSWILRDRQRHRERRLSGSERLTRDTKGGSPHRFLPFFRTDVNLSVHGDVLLMCRLVSSYLKQRAKSSVIK